MMLHKLLGPCHTIMCVYVPCATPVHTFGKSLLQAAALAVVSSLTRDAAALAGVAVVVCC